MENARIKAEAIKAITSLSGYCYSEAALDSAIARGIVEGDVLQTNGDWKVVVVGNTVICRNSKGETQGPVMSLEDPAFREKCLIMLAINAGRKGTTMGKM